MVWLLLETDFMLHSVQDDVATEKVSQLFWTFSEDAMKSELSVESWNLEPNLEQYFQISTMLIKTLSRDCSNF